MPKPIEKILLLCIDLLTINSAFLGFLQLRSTAHLFVEKEFPFLLLISFILYFFWLVIFLFAGLYQSWYTKSRYDELIGVFKTVSFGIFIIFLATLEPEQDLSTKPTLGRMLIVSYWGLMILFVGAGRMFLHTIQRKLLQAGIGQRNTIIIGWNRNARSLADKVKKYPALGYRVIGFLSLDKKEQEGNHDGLPVLGHIKKLAKIVSDHHVEEVILCLGKVANRKVIEIIGMCEELPVHIKIEPDLYNMVLGQARTNQIYGFPLIEVHPELMPPWEKKVKRLIDILFSFVALMLLSPILVLCAMLIKIDSPGPVFFKQKRIGRGGRVFTMYKFRSMIQDAERYTGPVWAGKTDPRITRVGRFIRKVRIDEFPQLFNVLNGDMSLVGPRPERPYFVDRLKREYPLYTRRLKVKPGITGWAQVKGKYDTTIEEVKEKLDYDLYYIDNISLRLDFLIMFYTIYVMLRFKGQ
ncbi:undecaprenyl-phosphate glucose phosphotransferase [candidate division KSB1 bacterium]|nr:undecaprenyl-phosphate glucose phosphotransferase [candidate division KSB1 bacterium]RQW00969.1 MAG: undecaprenyl-phosphate glucose phosphotransferase [candidate division KSB1 bacterium]